MTTLANLRNSIAALNFFGLGLRGASMLSKLVLVLLLSKYGTLENLGTYGLFVSSIVILNYLQGLEFNRFTAREIAVQDSRRTTEMVSNQLVVHLASYLVVLPLSLLIFAGGFLSWGFVVYFLWIAVFTHLGQETNRLLIIFASTTEAYLVSFIVHGLWALIVVIAFLFDASLLNLDFIFRLWCGFSVLGFLVGIVFLVKTNRFGTMACNFDSAWIKLGISVSFRFFVGVIAFKVIELSDRYFIQYFHGEALVGVYTFFGSVANIVQEFVYTGIVVTLIPGLLATYKNKEYLEYNRTILKLRQNIWTFSGLIAVLVIALMLALLEFINRDLLDQNFYSFVILVGACVVLNVSLIPHYRLYLAGEDSVLMWSALSGVVLNIVLNLLLIPKMAILGAALATVLSFSLVLAINYWCARNLIGARQQ